MQKCSVNSAVVSKQYAGKCHKKMSLETECFNNAELCFLLLPGPLFMDVFSCRCSGKMMVNREPVHEIRLRPININDAYHVEKQVK